MAGPEEDTMRAWRVHEYGEPLDVLRLEEVPVPDPGPGEVRVRVRGIPLNLNDLERITGGNMMVRPEFPYSPGMEVFGVVEACGDGADALQGRRVAATTRMAHGGYAERAICPAAATFEVPEDIALPEAAALYFPFHLAWLGLFDRAGLQAGETVLVHAAAGGSGSAAVQLAAHAGARVIATAGSEDKRRVCRDLGAEVTLDPGDGLAAAVLEVTGGRGVDVVFDNVGAAVFEASMDCLAYNGRYLMMGFASDKTVADEPFVVPRRLSMSNARLCGVLLNYADDAMVGMLKSAMGWNVAPTELGMRIMAGIVELVRTGAVRPLVGQVVDFDDLPAAVTALAERRTVGRVVVTT